MVEKGAYWLCCLSSWLLVNFDWCRVNNVVSFFSYFCNGSWIMTTLLICGRVLSSPFVVGSGKDRKDKCSNFRPPSSLWHFQSFLNMPTFPGSLHEASASVFQVELARTDQINFLSFQEVSSSVQLASGELLWTSSSWSKNQLCSEVL